MLGLLLNQPPIQIDEREKKKRIALEHQSNG